MLEERLDHRSVLSTETGIKNRCCMNRRSKNMQTKNV